MKSPNKHPVGFTHVWHALKTALTGMREAWQYEDAFRQELFIAAIAIPVDHTSLDQHPFAKRAKDIAGAAVLMSMVNAVVVWGMVLFA